MGTRHRNCQPSIQLYFRGSQWQSPGAIVAAPREIHEEQIPTPLQEIAPAHSPNPDPFTETPAAFRPEMADHIQSQCCLDADLRTVLRVLPTRADIEALCTRADIEALIVRIE